MTVLVVEQDSEIIGCWAAITVLHAEGVWVHPDHQKKASVARSLWVGMRRIAARLGVSSVVTGAANPAVRALIERHHGLVLPEAFVLPLKGVT
jgi:acetyltransferase (GNAT) family protein